MKLQKIEPVFVEYMPDVLESGMLYISMEYGSVVHLCCCGCGGKVVTPLSPTDWTIWSNGNVVSLNPSVGNWSFPCQSHYWIRNNLVVWSDKWSKERVEIGRRTDQAKKAKHYGKLPEVNSKGNVAKTKKDKSRNVLELLFEKIREILK